MFFSHPFTYLKKILNTVHSIAFENFGPYTMLPKASLKARRPQNKIRKPPALTQDKPPIFNKLKK